MPTVAVFHTNDTWSLHRILWSGHYALRDKTYLFGDGYSCYITGSHSSTLSGYGGWGAVKKLTRLTYSGSMAIAGFSGGGGMSYNIGGPDTTAQGGKIAHYLNEWGEALGSAYAEIDLASGVSQIHYHESYPETEEGWDLDASGIGRGINDIIGLDYPDEPRVIVSTWETTPPSEGIVVINTHVVSGYAEGEKVNSDLSLLPSGISITDLEAHQVL